MLSINTFVKLSTLFFLIAFLTTYISGCSQNDQRPKPGKITFTVDDEYWEGCETGTGECIPLVVIRKNINDTLLFKMPCGGTQTRVDLIAVVDNKILETVSVTHDECPPIFNLTELPDGKYKAQMYACGLGGAIHFTIATKKQQYQPGTESVK